MKATTETIQPRQLALLIAGIVALVFLFKRVEAYSRQRRFAKQYGCKPIANSATKEPILGLDLTRKQLRAAKAHKTLEEATARFKKYGNTFRSRQFLQSTIMTIEPDNIKTILALKFDDYGIGHRIKDFGPLLGLGIFDADGQHWHSSRALIRPNFTRDQVADLAAFERLIPDLFSLIPRDGKTTVDLQDIFFCYTIDSATEFLFGQSVGSLKKIPDAEISFAEAFNCAQDAVRMRVLLGPLYIFGRDPKTAKCETICRDIAQQFAEGAIEAVEHQRENQTDDETHEKPTKYVFAHELARRTSDKRRIRDELMNVLLAGRDTTASLLSNLFFMLAKNPVVWAKLQAEVATLEGRLPTFEELRKLKYLRCCLNESLRIHPVVPMNSRKAVKDTFLPVGGGPDGKSPVFVPKGTRTVYSTYAMHRRTDLYGPDADEFCPERWETGKLLPRWEYLPFNGGPRVCLGQQYALTEASYVIVRIAQEFSGLESRDPGPWEEKLTLTLCSRNGTKVCLKPACRPSEYEK
ncbi:hypothetical protein E4U57_004396 [Claviceps arundinis]|uniref:N-alkane-inducible cytochrome P450 n=1 Tax=Claviceps arundinis TaxID=1623583 RepID=A0A9P7MYL3_9HYPO|nr:hypothetical protein E4U57_004396 [Claviceps arundinis]KAG5974409.1 hypothetical protein E4U56_004736 [Claviceps arundinis]